MLSQFKEHYELHLKDDLELLEQERLTIKRKVLRRLYFLLIVLVLLIAFIAVSDKDMPVHEALLIILCIYFLSIPVLVFYRFYKTYYPFKRTFSEQIVSKLLGMLSPDATHLYDDGISYSDIKQSKIFHFRSKSGYQVVSSDLIKGRNQGAPFKFALVEIRTGESTMFNGAFLIIETERVLQGETIIREENNTFYSNTPFTSMLNRLFNFDAIEIQFDHKEFEAAYSVFTTNETEARSIVTPELMDWLVEFANTIRRRIVLSFVGNTIHVALHYKERELRLEPKLLGPPLGKETVVGIVEYLATFFSIIQRLHSLATQTPA